MQVTGVYIVKQILRVSLQVVLWMLLLVLIVDWVGQTQKLSMHYRWFDALNYVLLMAPSRLQLCMPIAMLLSGLLLMWRLHNSQEWLALQTLGCSFWHVLRYLLLAGIIVVGISYSIIEGIAPRSLFKAKQLRSNIHNNMFLTSSGVWWWNESDIMHNKTFNYIRDVNHDGSIAGVLILVPDATTGEIERVIKAKTGKYIDNYWVLSEVVVREIKAGEKVEVANLRIDWQLTPKLLDVLAHKDKMLSLWVVYKRWQFAKISFDSTAITHGYNFFHRLYAPILSLLFFIYVWCCNSLSLRSARSKVSMLCSVGVGLLVYLVDLSLKPLLVFMAGDLSLLVAMPLLLLVLIMLSYNYKFILNRFEYE